MNIQITPEIEDKCFEIMNNIKEKYNWNVMIKNSADEMGIDVNDLENYVTSSGRYKWDNEIKKYIKK